MTAATRLRIELEFPDDGEPIQGVVSRTGEPLQSFTGWLGLLEVIHRLHEHRRSTEEKGNR